MNKYRVVFYQCGVYGIDPEYYRSKKEACKAACEFLKYFEGLPGHRRIESVYRDGCGRVVDYFGGTEALAEVQEV